jgi:hypothetical protein
VSTEETPTMGGFEWSPSEPYVATEPGEDGWCVRDAVRELLGWAPGSREWTRFIEGPRGQDTPGLAKHLGLTTFEFQQDWNDLIQRTEHPGIAIFDFPAYRKSHAVYVCNIAALIHHWPKPLRPPATPDDRWLIWYGWPLHEQHLVRGAELGVVLVDERQLPRAL